MQDTPMTDPAEIAAAHAGTLVLDTHVDIPWPDPPHPATATRRQVDYGKMRAGGMNAAVYIAYVRQGPLTDEGRATAADKALRMLRAIAAQADGAPSGALFCRDAARLEAAFAAGRTAILAAVENGYAMGRDLTRIADWKALGAIYLTLTHDGHNDLADSARPRADLDDPAALHGGLSPLGRAAVRELNRVGMLVDVSHASRDAMLQAADLSRSPVVATHAGGAALCAHPRNLDDAQLDALRAVGGLVQVTAVPAFLRATPDGQRAVAAVRDYCDHVDHAVRRIGVEHVGLSSDFDGGGGLADWMDAAQTGNVSAELLRRGYSRTELRLLWSGNFLRLMRIAAAVARA
jgi:membrane dipeptidase